MRLLTFAAIYVLACATASAEAERATILADRIGYLAGSTELFASGNVEVYFQEFLLQASEIHYLGGVITAAGPLTLTTDGDSVAVADYAQLDQNLRSAILQGVEVLLDQRLHIAAARFNTEESRYVLLQNAIVTTCRICKQEETPIWHFRSRSVVLDRQEETVYLRNASFVLAGIPLFNLQSLRLPSDATTRRSGFLVPKLAYSSDRGSTLGLPYYLTLGDHADVTITPFLNTRSYQYLGIEGRRRFRRGWIDINGSVAPSPRRNRGLKSHLAIASGWDLGNRFKLSLSGSAVSEKDYLRQYGISNDSQITNRIGVSRRGVGSYFEYETYQVRQLRTAQIQQSLPNLTHEAHWRTQFSPRLLGGNVGFEFNALWLGRNPHGSQLPSKVQRLSAATDWYRRTNLQSGAVVNYFIATTAHAYEIESQTDYPQKSTVYATGVAAIDLSLPLIRVGDRSKHLLEPFLQMAWSPERDLGTIPNEDSPLVEFDTNNLRSVNRFSGLDRFETGLRLNAGLKHTTVIKDSHELELVLGRVIRDQDHGQFSIASGLAGAASDYVASGDLRIQSGVGIKQKLTFSDTFDVASSTTSLHYNSDEFRLDIGYSTMKQDRLEGMTDDANSLVSAMRVGLADGWFFTSDVNLDFNRKAKSTLEFGLEYSHNCIDFSAKLERTLRTEQNPESSDRISFLVTLGGISSKTESSTAGCMGG